MSEGRGGGKALNHSLGAFISVYHWGAFLRMLHGRCRPCATFRKVGTLLVYVLFLFIARAWEVQGGGNSERDRVRAGKGEWKKGKKEERKRKRKDGTTSHSLEWLLP